MHHGLSQILDRYIVDQNEAKGGGFGSVVFKDNEQDQFYQPAAFRILSCLQGISVSNDDPPALTRDQGVDSIVQLQERIDGACESFLVMKLDKGRHLASACHVG